MSNYIQPIIDRKIRLGFIGCGRISKSHFDAINKHTDNIELVAVCDQDASRAEQAASSMASKAYTNIDTMLEQEQLDIVTVASPNGLHPEHVMKVADHGVHVITEKPMAIDLSDGFKIHQHCKEKKVQLFVVHQNRFNDTVQEIWKAIEAGRFGKLYMITSNVFWTRPQDYYDKEGSWHGTQDMDGGAFYTQASHYIDLMQWLARANASSVFANLKTLARNIETEDTGSALIEWDNGVLGAINVTMLTYPKNLEGSVTLLGEKGTVKLGGVAMNKIEHWQFEDTHDNDQNIMNSNYNPTSVYGYGHVRYYENIVQCFKNGAKPLVDGQEGLNSLLLLAGIKESNHTQKKVHLNQ